MAVPIPIQHRTPAPVSLAESVAEALRGFLYSAVQPGKNDAVILPVQRPNGVKSLEITIRCSGMYGATVTEPAVVRAIATIRRLDDLDAILEPYGVTYDSDSEQLTSEPVRLFGRLPERVWELAQCCLVIFATADALTEPIVTVQPEMPKADPMTPAIVAAGQVLQACERRCLPDLFPAWTRLLAAVAQPRGAGELTAVAAIADVFPEIRRAVTVALANLDAIDSRRHWRYADELIRSVAAQEARKMRANALGAYRATEDSDRPFDGLLDRFQRAADYSKAAHVYEQIAAGLA